MEISAPRSGLGGLFQQTPAARFGAEALLTQRSLLVWNSRFPGVHRPPERTGAGSFRLRPPL